MASQEFTKVVDVYKKTRWTLKSIAKPYIQETHSSYPAITDLYDLGKGLSHQSRRSTHYTFNTHARAHSQKYITPTIKLSPVNEDGGHHFGAGAAGLCCAQPSNKIHYST